MIFRPLAREAHAFAFVLGIFLLGQSARAATITWDGGPIGTGSALNTGTNWVGDAVPTTSDEALFDNSVVATLPAQLTTTGANLVFGDFLWNTNDSSTVTINTTGTTNRTITLSGGGGSTAAIAAGGASGDLLLMGTSATTNTLTFSENANTGTAKLSLVLGTSGNFDVVNSGATLNIGVAITQTGGSRSVTKTGNGLLIYSGASANTYSGTTTVSTGELDLGKTANVTAIGGDLTINGGTVKYTGTSTNEIADTATVTIAGGTLDLNNNSDSIATLIFNSGTLTSTGGTQTLTLLGGGAALQMRGGTVIPTSVNLAFRASTVGVGLTFDASANGTATINGNIDLNSGFGTSNPRVFTINNGAATTDTLITGVISASSGANLTKAGLGTLVLSGTNTYNGDTVVSAGILNIQNGSALGTTAANSTTVNSGATLQLQGGITVGAEALTISGTGASGQAGALVNVSDTNNYGGLLHLNAASTISSDSGSLNFTHTGTITGATFGLTLTGAGDGSIASIIGTTTGTLTKSGSGTWTLSGANTYSGGTTINAGILKMSGSGTLGSTSGTLSMAGGTLDLNGTNQSVGALNGSSGTILNEAPSGGGGPKTLTVGTGDTSGSFSGTITDHDGLGSGFVKLVKTGSGTQTMTSTTSNYTGGTDINGGVLISDSSNGGALGRGPINVNSGGTLAGAQTIDSAATITVNSGGTLMPGATASAGSIAKLNTGSVTLASGSNFAVDVNAGAGPTGIGAGTIYDQVSVTGTLTLAGTLTVNPGAGLVIGDKFFIMLNDGIDAVSGTFSGLPNLSTFSAGGDTFLINYFDSGDGFANDISLTVTAIPEPGTWLGAALTMSILLCTQRRRLSRRMTDH